MRYRILALAAHPDDLALSIGGTLTLLRDRTELMALTLFGLSAWIRPDFDAHGADISDLRAAEESRFFACARIPGAILPLRDSSLRGYTSASEIGFDTHRSQTISCVRTALSDVIAHYRPDAALVPAAIGAHVDHVAARDSVTALLTTPGVLAFYEDLPYGCYAPEQFSPLCLPMPFTGFRRLDVCIDKTLSAKQHYLQLYPSQLSAEDRQIVKHHAHAVSGCARPVERWLVAADTPLAAMLSDVGS